MRHLHRGVAPALLSNRPEDQERRRLWYGDLRDAEDRIRDRWNQHAENGTQPIREAVRTLGSGCCAWCGIRLPGRWEVDHYLPKSRFPRLAYCWEVMLPSCVDCNLRKHTFSPKSIPKDALIDPALSPEQEGDRLYVPQDVLPPIGDRLVDPSFDDPATHLRFEPAVHVYVALTAVGQTTMQHMYDEKDDARGWETLSKNVRDRVEHAVSNADLENSLQVLIELVGREVYIRAYAQYWVSMLGRPKQ